MRRRPLLFAVLLILAAVGLVLGGLGLLLKQEPGFYAAGGDDPDDEAVAAGVLTRLGDLKNDVRSRPEWGATFSAAELNAFFRQHLDDGEGFAGLLPGNLHDPRVAVEGDRLKIAGRYGRGLWSTVVSVELRPWLVKDEVNTVAVELVGMRAGALPVGSQSVLDSISEAARDSNIEVTWYRHNGHPVGLFRFYADQTRPPTQIRTVRVADGKVTVAGRSVADSVIAAGAPAAP